nr:nitrous oxide reductase maturation transmembrane protein [uncultured bacterium]
MTRLLAIAACELRIAMRNRWVAIAVAIMSVFALAVTAAGAAPTGTLGVDRLTLAVASLTNLGIYLMPLVALLISFDAIAGEIERGTLALVLTYPVSRAEILGGKFLAHLGVLALASVVGYGLAAGLALWADPSAGAGLPALWRLLWSSLLLGAVFLGIGYALSARARRPGTAAGLAIAVWLVLVVLYDLALLAAVVADQGGSFTTDVFPALLVANPADAFRLFNLAASEGAALATGIAGAADTLPTGAALASIVAWPLAAFALAVIAFRRIVP